MIIDCHSHLHEVNRRSDTLWFAGEPEGPLPVERFAAHAQAEPVDHMIISAHSAPLTTPEALVAANDAVARAVGAYPRFFSGLCQVNPHFVEVSLAEMEKHIAAGGMAQTAPDPPLPGRLAGIGELCQYLLDYETDDPRVFPFIERAVELGVPILEHTSREPHTSGLDRLAGQFPQARFIMAHLGGMHNWPAGLEVARRHENVWVDTSGYVMVCTGAMERALDELGAARLLFGVDYPGAQAGPLVAALERLDLPSADLDRIAFKNAAELFGLDTATIGQQKRVLVSPQGHKGTKEQEARP